MPLGLVFRPSMGFNDLHCHVNTPCESCRFHTMKSISSTSFSIQFFAATPRLQKPGSQKKLERPCLSLHHHPRNIFVKLALLPSRSPLVVAPSHVKMEGNASRTSSRFQPISYITRDGNLNKHEV